MKELALAIIIPVLKLLFASFSPVLRGKLEAFIRDFYATALSTTSPWDDFLAELLAGICGVDVSGVSAVGSGGTVMPAEVRALLMGSIRVASPPSTGFVAGTALTEREMGQ